MNGQRDTKVHSYVIPKFIIVKSTSVSFLHSFSYRYSPSKIRVNENSTYTFSLGSKQFFLQVQFFFSITMGLCKSLQLLCRYITIQHCLYNVVFECVTFFLLWFAICAMQHGSFKFLPTIRFYKEQETNLLTL